MRRAILLPVLCAALASAGAGTAAAQATHAHHGHHAAYASGADSVAIRSFVAGARAATERYRDRAAAIADGFRILGPDFPAMGEHWVHPGRMVDGTLDVDRPQALSYARIGGRPVLIGVIYARPLRADEPAPDFPVPGAPWHDHVGAIDEESVLLHHVPTTPGEASGVRLSMLHAWVWSENPDGVFAADNWALPFLRLGLAPPERILQAAARSLSLLSGGDAYHRLLFRALAAPTAAEDEAARTAIERARAEVEGWYRERSGNPVTGEEMERLGRSWNGLWAEIGAGIRPEAADRLNRILSP